MKYFIHWIDRYSKGYRQGVTHATPDDGLDKSLCGIDYSKTNVDGGYKEVDNHSKVECKKCVKRLSMLLTVFVLWLTFSHAQTFETNDPKTLFDDIVIIDSVKYHVMSYTNTPHYDLYRITDEINVFELFIWSDGKKYSLIKLITE